MRIIIPTAVALWWGDLSPELREQYMKDYFNEHVSEVTIEKAATIYASIMEHNHNNS